MNKVLGLICILVAAGGLGWKLLTAALSVAEPRETVYLSETSYDPEGRVASQTRTERKMLTVTRLRVNEGAEILVTAEGLELQNAGTMSLEAPIVSQVNDLFWWAMIVTNLTAGLWLLKRKKAPAA